jgi:hypothetical protein
LVAAAFAAPQYGPAPQTVEASQQVSFDQWASLNPVELTATQYEPAAPQFVEVAPQISSQQWGTQHNGLQTEQRPQIEEIQRQWEKFIE